MNKCSSNQLMNLSQLSINFYSNFSIFRISFFLTMKKILVQLVILYKISLKSLPITENFKISPSILLNCNLNRYDVNDNLNR